MKSNKKSEIPHVVSELQDKPRSLLRTVLIMVAYLSAFIFLDFITRQFEVLPGIVAWYPPAGLTYALLLVFGVRFTPAVTIALFLSSLFVYRLPQPSYLLFLWALIISLIYCAAAAFLRHRIHLDLQLRKLRDVVWFVFTIVMVSALLAILSVSSSALSSAMPQSEVIRAILNWWIGETVGVLTVTPFMLIYVIPALKRFANGQPTRFPAGRSFSRLTPSIIIQGASLAFTFYWVFGAPISDEFRPLILLTLPLIWITLGHGLKGAIIAILLMNTGLVLAAWLFRFGSAQLTELELFVVITCVLGLLIGAVVTERKQEEEELIVANKELVFQNEEKEKRAAELNENKTLLASVLDSSLSGIMAFKSIRNAEGAIMDFEWQLVNAAAEQMVSRSQAEIVGKRLLEEMPGNREEGLFDLYVRVVETGIPLSHEHYYEHETVKTWFDTVAIKRLDGFVVTFSNITERKQAEQELIIANKELLFQNEEKEKRAAELIVANKELAFQNEEKEKRATELVIANKELNFQNEEKGKRAAELIVANKELVFQNEEKEKRAAELTIAIEETVRHLQNIQALSTIDQAIAGSLDLNLTLNVILEQVKTQLNGDATAILLLNPHTLVLEFAAGTGFRSKEIESSHLRLGEGIVGRAALERKTMSFTNLLENINQFVDVPLFDNEGFVAFFVTPLIAKGQVNGVLEVFHRAPFEPDENWLEFFKVLAGQTAIAVDSASLFTELRHSNSQLFAAYDSTIEGWSHALDLRDKETEGHTQRVTEMTMKLARAAGIIEEELVHVRRGALLHDIGKMGVSDHILLKPGKLTDEEWVAMRKHTSLAFELLSPIAYLRPALDIPYCHHEKWDGSGYPRGLKSEQIPLVARLFAIIDVWDALLSDRPYRQGWPKEKVIEHIKSLSGTHFDPKAVELFFNIIIEDEKDAG